MKKKPRKGSEKFDSHINIINKKECVKCKNFKINVRL